MRKMQFSVKTVLLMIASLPVAIGLVTFFDSFTVTRESFKHSRARSAVVRLSCLYEDELLSKHPNGLPLDPWGNQYRFKSSENHDGILVFSTGEDGKTLSSGNDDDDVSSWNMWKSDPFYLQNIRTDKRIAKLRLAALLSPFVFVVLVALVAAFKRIKA